MKTPQPTTHRVHIQKHVPSSSLYYRATCPSIKMNAHTILCCITFIALSVHQCIHSHDCICASVTFAKSTMSRCFIKVLKIIVKMKMHVCHLHYMTSDIVFSHVPSAELWSPKHPWSTAELQHRCTNFPSVSKHVCLNNL